MTVRPKCELGQAMAYGITVSLLLLLTLVGGFTSGCIIGFMSAWRIIEMKKKYIETAAG